MIDKQLILSMAERVQDPFRDYLRELDMTNGGKGEVSYFDERIQRNVAWDRAKSNENVKSRGFSFFFAVTIFQDDFYMLWKTNQVNGQDRDMLVGVPYGDSSVSLLVVVKTEVLGDTVRIISAWENESSQIEDKYERIKKDKLNRQRRGRHQSFDYSESVAEFKRRFAIWSANKAIGICSGSGGPDNNKFCVNCRMQEVWEDSSWRCVNVRHDVEGSMVCANFKAKVL